MPAGRQRSGRCDFIWARDSSWSRKYSISGTAQMIRFSRYAPMMAISTSFGTLCPRQTMHGHWNRFERSRSSDGSRDSPSALRIESVIYNELSIEDLVVAQAECTEAVGDSPQALACHVRIARWEPADRTISANRTRAGSFRGAVFVKDRVERNLFAMMPQLTAWHVVDGPVSIDFYFFPRDPLHTGTSSLLAAGLPSFRSSASLPCCGSRIRA